MTIELFESLATGGFFTPHVYQLRVAKSRLSHPSFGESVLRGVSRRLVRLNTNEIDKKYSNMSKSKKYAHILISKFDFARIMEVRDVQKKQRQKPSKRWQEQEQERRDL